MEFDISRFRETFHQEADEHLAAMEAGLLQLESNPDEELLNGVSRGAHSIKGASRTFGFEDIARFTHALEGLLDRMRAGQVSPSPARIGLMLKALDTLRGLLEAARNGTAIPKEAAAIAQSLFVAQRAGDYRPDEPAPVRSQDSAVPCWRIRFAPSQDLLRQGMDPVLVLRELSRFGDVLQVDADLSRLPSLASLQPDTCYLAWNVRLASQATQSQIRDAFAFVEDGATLDIHREAAAGAVVPPSAPPSPRAMATTESGTIRVATGKVDRLIDLVGELVIAQSMASQVLSAFAPSDLARLQESFAEVERYTRELQSRLMGIRMLPIGSAFSRFPRLVRDLAAATGKQVALAIHGEETELDKSVVERMADPLTHLVRNAIDHGIEPTEDRIAAGKPGHRRHHPSRQPSGRQRGP